MIENCCLYFPRAKVPIDKVIEGAEHDGGIFKAATWFTYETAEGPIRLSVMTDGMDEHLRGFRGYVTSLPGADEAKAEAFARIGGTKSVLGVQLPQPVGPDSEAFASLVFLISQFDGYMFVADSIMRPDGSFVVGPMSEAEEEDDEPIETDPEKLRHEEGPRDGIADVIVARREANYVKLAERGFACARWLPLVRSEDGSTRIRPAEELAARLFALEALFLWVAAPEEVATTERVKNFVANNELLDALTAEEREMITAERDEARAQQGTVGWRLENMWALSWMFGFEPAPEVDAGQMPPNVTGSMIQEFLPDLDGTIDAFLQSHELRAAEVVEEMEDLYYCAHNAVRSAQMGKRTVPRSFHPIGDGGTVHERRHALTWALSPGVAWDDTDLST